MNFLYALTTAWTLLLSLLSLVGAAKDSADVSFINFSSQPIPLYWYDFNGDNFVQVATIQPYEITRMETFLGHRFAYDTVDQEKITHDVKIKRAVQAIGVPETKLQVFCGTTKGDLHITVEPNWSPLGAARFLELVSKKYFDGCSLNRVVKGFLTQFGISADYEQRTKYRSRTIPDDTPSKERIEFQPGYMAYAGSGPDSRSTEMFIVMPDTPLHQRQAFGTNPWETPFAYVDPEDVENVVGSWYAYGDMPPWGKGPDPQLMYKKDGYEYLKKKFPQMDYIDTCRIVRGDDEAEEEL